MTSGRICFKQLAKTFEMMQERTLLRTHSMTFDHKIFQNF